MATAANIKCDATSKEGSPCEAAARLGMKTCNAHKTKDEMMEYLDSLYPNLPGSIRRAASLYWDAVPYGIIEVDYSCLSDGAPHWYVRFATSPYYY